MNDHFSAEDLSAYFDQALPLATMQEMAYHLSECADCRRQLAEVQSVSLALRKLPAPAVPAFFAARLAGRIRARQERNVVAEFVWLGKRLVPALALLVAAFIAWNPFAAVETPLQWEEYLSAANPVITLLGEDNGELTKEEVLELVVLTSSATQE